MFEEEVLIWKETIIHSEMTNLFRDDIGAKSYFVESIAFVDRIYEYLVLWHIHVLIV